MTFDLLAAPESANPVTPTPADFWQGMSSAIADVPGPVAAISIPALRHNTMDMLVRSGGLPIRVASKSVRVRQVIESVLEVPGYHGILAFTLPEALWLAGTHDDVVMGYPTVDRGGLRALVADDRAAARVTLMVDDDTQLDAVDAIAAPSARPEIRVAIDADASWRSSALGHIGVRRSPLYNPAQVQALAQRIADRPGFRLVGVMMYEAQIAGQVDDDGARSLAVRWMKQRSEQELLDRRGAIVRAVSAVTPLEFVNGGGTGSLEYTASDPSVTEATAGSGLLAGHLFDGYRGFTPAPTAAFALEVVRKPAPDIVTVLGGGWIASGPPVASRQPIPVWPAGLTPFGLEGTGEVQTPLRGEAARRMKVGDRVWFRHSKSGELSERINAFHLVDGDRLVGEVPTYRGEGRAFL